MNIIKKRAEKRFFQAKISGVSICCTVLAIIISAIAMYQGAKQSVDRLSEQFFQKLVHQVRLNVDENISRFSSIFISIELDPKFTDVLDSADEISGVDIKNEAAFQNTMFKFQLINRDITGIYVFDKNGRPYYSSSSPSLKQNYHIEEETWFPELKDSGGKYIIGTSVPDRYLLNDTKVISLVQRVNNLSNDDLYGTIILDIDSRIFDKIVSTLDPSSDSIIVIADSRGKVIYESNEDGVMKGYGQYVKEQVIQNNALWRSDDGSFYMDYEGSSINVNFTTSAETGWRVISIANLSEISQLRRNIAGKICLVILAAILLTGTAILLITKKQFDTLYVLQNVMKEVRNGNYNTKISIDSKDEIADLCMTFNEMVDRTNLYINTVERLKYEKQAVQLKKVQAELDTLQAQINPHFIYNSLETISMMAELNDDEQIEKMATALGKLMRISIKGDRIVSIRKELECLSYYILIQKTRFGDKFDISICMDPQILDCQIPKLILQPLVENCINHGISSMSGKGRVEIYGTLSDDAVSIEVIDNGVGISEERLEEIRSALESEDSGDGRSRDSIGLRNVNQRLKLYFQDRKCGVSVSSAVGHGTKIVVTCPLIHSRGDLDD